MRTILVNPPPLYPVAENKVEIVPKTLFLDGELGAFCNSVDMGWT